MTFDPDKYLEDRGISLDEGSNETPFDPDTWLKQKSELQASTLDTYDNAITDTPEQIARFKGLSEKTGVPYETAKLIPDQVESIANKPNWKMINEDSPKTAAWLARDPRNLGLTRSELKRLQAIEKGRTSGETAQDYAVSLTQGFSVAGASIFGSMDLAREALIPDTTEAVLLHLGKMLTGYAPDDMGVVSNMARTGVDFKEATSASQFLKSDYSKAQKAEVDRKFDEGFWSGVKSMVVDNPNQAGEMVVESLPLMASLVGAVRVKAAQVFNGTYQRAIAQGLGETQAKLLGQKAVEKMVPELAKFGAMVEGAQQAGSSAADYAADGDITGKEATGAIGSGITTMLDSRFSNFLGDKVGVKDLESSLASIGIDSPKATSAAAIGGRMIGGAVKEGPIEEGLQSLTEGMWSNYVEGRPIFDNAEKNFAQGSVLGIATNTGISVLTESTNAYRHHQIKKFQAEHQAEKILGEIKTISESKLMQTSPQTWREYMDSIDGYIEHVYINPNDLVESGMDVETFLQSVPTAAAEIRRAIETNSFVTIPKNELIVGLSSIPDADFVAGIVSHLRTEQQKESLAELNKKQETLLEDLQGEVEKNLQDKEKLQEFREKQKQIETSLMETMLSAGFDRKNAKPQAQLVSSFYTVMAGRAGVDPVEYYESNFGNLINQPLQDTTRETLERELSLAQSVYHGTPYRFDKFSLDAIGTGEGAQAFGWGLYFSGKRYVAEYYRDTLSNDKSDIESFIKKKHEDIPNDLATAFYIGIASGESPSKNIATSLLSKPQYAELITKNKKEISKTLRQAKNLNKGNLYQVDIPEDSELLDWNKSFSDQPEAIKEKLKKAIENSLGGDFIAAVIKYDKGDERALKNAGYNIFDYPGSVGGIYEAMSIEKGAKWASNHLNKHGIKGLRYLGDSLAQNGFDDFYNYVIWDETAVTLEAVNDELVQARAISDNALDGGVTSSSGVFHHKSRSLIRVEDVFGDTLRQENVVEKVRDYYKSALQGATVSREGVGEIRFSGKGWKKVKRGLTVDIEKAKYIPSIKGVVENGEYKGRHPLHKQRKDNIVAFHYFEGDVVVGAGKPTRIQVAVGEDENGNLFYDLQRNKAQSNSRSSARAFEPSGDNFTLNQSIVEDEEFINITVLNSEDGSVIRGTFNPANHDITLLKDANLSTFLHEAGHLFLELTFDLSTRDGASDSLRQDVAKILDWFGLESLDEWASLSFEEKRVFHEKWAESFEQYLMDGRAPSAELQSAFRTFKRWMIQIYKSLKAFLASNENADLTDEVRQVFDRMLASEQQIKSLMIAQGRMPVFDVKPDGMTDEEWEEYQQQYLKTEEEAIEALTARMLRDMEWLRKNRRSEIKRKIEEEVRDQVMSEGIYRVWTWLTKTTPTDGGSFMRGTPDQKLDIAALTDQLGEENKDLVDRLRSRGMASQKGTQDANEVADRFGYESALQMAVELDQMILPDEIIRQRTEEEMIKRHADIPTWQDLEAAADELIHRKAHSRFLATELARMKAAYGKPSLVTKAAKQYADQLVSALKINELKVSMYQASETREGKKADKFWKQGNHSEAAMAKRNQLLHHNTVAEIQQAKKEVSKGLKHIRKLNSKNGQKTMRGDNRVQLNRFMARFDFRQSPNAQQQAVNNMSLREFITAEAQRLSMPVPDLSSPIYDEQFRKHYKDMTVEEFRGVMDVIRQLEALARREQQVYTAIKQMTFQQEKASILDTLRKHYPKFFDGEDKPINPNHSLVPNTSQKFRKLGEGFMAQFLSVETLLNLYDGGELGQMHQSFFKRISDRMEWFHNFSKEVDDYLKPHFDAYSKIEKVQFATKDIGSKTIGISITRNQALGVLLLYGNPEGRQRLSNRWNETTLHQIMGLLDEKDVNLANAIWRTFDNKLWPELEGVNKRTIGMAPPKVQAISFTTNKGYQARGGYFRLKPDNEEVPTYDRFDEEKAINVLMNGVGMSAKTDQSSSQTRIQDLQYKPDLDAMSLLSHTVHETLHDVAYREAVLDTWRLLQDPEIATAMKNIGGKDVYRVIRQRIGEIAVPPVEDRGILENIVSTARRNTVATLLSGIGTAFQNLTGIFPAFLRVHNGLLAREIARSANPLEMKRMYDLMIEKSVYMPNRIKQFDRDMVKDIASMKMGIRSLNPVPDLSVALAAMGWVDRMVTIPVWSAAFAEGMIKYNNDENMAAEYADHIIRQTMGSGRQFDLAKVMTGNAWMKLFTMFHSYFNGQLQLAVREGILSAREVRTNPARAASRLAASVMLLWIIPAILTELSRQAPDDEDDEERIDRVARAVVLYPTAMFPLLRDVAPYYYDSLFSDRAYSPKMSPAFAGVESVKKGAESAMDEEKDVKDISNMIMAGSFLVGLPGIMLKDFWEGTHAFVTGETNNPVEILVGTPPGR